MTHNATHGIRNNIPIDILSIDKNIHANDLVYIDNRSLKIIPFAEENINKIQESLQQLQLQLQLQKSLNSVGRKSLARRSAKQHTNIIKKKTTGK